MIERKKVIKALECRKNADKRCGNPCEDTGLCHYATAVRGLDGEIYRPFICDRERICADALSLLKEQPEIEPKQVDLYGKDEWYGLVCVCPDCKAEWMSDKDDTHFCPKCGQAVKWDG